MNGFVAVIVIMIFQFGFMTSHLKDIKKQNVIIDEKIDVLGELVDECQEH